MFKLIEQLQNAFARNDSAAVAALRSKLATRMARVCTPEHQIAFILGLSIKLLRATYGSIMKIALASANAIFQDTLFYLATVRKNAPSVRLWAKLHNNNPASKSNNTKNPKRTYMDRILPGTILFVGPDGEPA